jgi:hypothetical protein
MIISTETDSVAGIGRDTVMLSYRSFLYWTKKSSNFLNLFWMFPAQPNPQLAHPTNSVPSQPPKVQAA